MISNEKRFGDRIMNIVPDATSTDVSADLKVKLVFKGSLPFITKNQFSAGVVPEKTSSNTIKYDASLLTSRLGTPNDAEFVNALYDPDMPDRFKHFAFGATSSTRASCYVVWDKKFKDVFLVPNLRSLGQNKLKGRTITILAFLVGATGLDNFNGFNFGVDADIQQLPEPLVNANCTVHSMATQGKYNGDIIASSYRFNLDDGSMETHVVGVKDYLGMGENQYLFGAKVSCYQAVVRDRHCVTLYNCGMQDINDVLIPLPF